MLLGSDLLKGLKPVRGFLVITKFGSPRVKACVIQCGSRCFEVGGLQGF